MLSVLLGQVVEAAPALAVFDIFELLVDLLLGVTGALDDLPEGDEFVDTDHAVVVDVDGVEELTGRDLAKRVLPVVQRLLLVDVVALVHVEDSKHFVHFRQGLGRQFLQKEIWRSTWSDAALGVRRYITWGSLFALD